MQKQSADIGILFDSAQAYNAVASALSDYFTFHKIPLKEYAAEGALDARLIIFCVNIGGKATYERVKGAIKRCRGETLFVLPAANDEKILQLRQHTKADYFILPLDAEKFRAAVKSAFNRPVEKAWSNLEPVKQNAFEIGRYFVREMFRPGSAWRTCSAGRTQEKLPAHSRGRRVGGAR